MMAEERPIRDLRDVIGEALVVDHQAWEWKSELDRESRRQDADILMRRLASLGLEIVRRVEARDL